MRDLMNNIHVKPVIVPVAAAITDDTAQVGTIIDHQGFDSVTYIIMTGTLADANATFAVLLEDGDNSSLTDNAAVADAELIGTEALAAFTFADDSECRKIGYRGSKRYSRLTITPSGNTGNAPLVALCVLGHAQQQPQINPPA